MPNLSKDLSIVCFGLDTVASAHNTTFDATTSYYTTVNIIKYIIYRSYVA